MIVAEHTGLEIVDLPDLREYRFGEAQGLLWSEAQARFGFGGRDWGSGGVPGEEGTSAFRDRVSQQIEELAQRHASDVAIAVLHGGVVGALVSRLMGLADSEYAADLQHELRDHYAQPGHGRSHRRSQPQRCVSPARAR